MRCLSHQLSSSSRGAFQRPAGRASRCCAVAVRAGAVRAPLREDKRKFYEANANRPKKEMSQPRDENAEGDFYVDQTCIDCQACRWVAPEIFSAVGLQAAVTQQPTTKEGRVRALQALLSCPVFAIHARKRDPSELQAAQEALPRPWLTAAPGVFHCGWHSNASYGGAGWLLVRPEGGNILVDSPRFNPVLAKQIEKMGGVKFIFLTHKDDVADHDKWAKHFGATRIIHEREATESQGTSQCEVQLKGTGPWEFPDGDGDLTIVHTPGHTDYHCVLFSAKHKALFSGDHLSGAEEESSHWKPDGRLFIYDEFNWFSVPQQLQSVQKLLDYDWLHVLPGHGAPARLRDAAERLEAVSTLLQAHAAKMQA